MRSLDPPSNRRRATANRLSGEFGYARGPEAGTKAAS